jgi:hypothetical protein
MSKKTENLISLLAENYPAPDYAFLPEFRGGTGWGRESRADAIAMDLWPSKGLELIGFELKTSRADWQRELKQPDKADPIKQFCDRWYLVVDDWNIVKHHFVEKSEVPNDWGFIRLDDSIYLPKLKTIKEAPQLNPIPIDRLFLASLMRRASNVTKEINLNGRTYKLI